MILKFEHKIRNAQTIYFDFEERFKREVAIELSQKIADNFLNMRTEIRGGGNWDEETRFTDEIVVLNRQTSDVVNEHLKNAMAYFKRVEDLANYERIRIISELIFEH